MNDGNAVANLESRVTDLERELGAWRKRTIGLILLILVIGIVAVWVNKPDGEKNDKVHDAVIPEIVRARRFEIVDHTGKVRGELAYTSEKGIYIDLGLATEHRVGLVATEKSSMITVSSPRDGFFASTATAGISIEQLGKSELILADGRGANVRLTSAFGLGGDMTLGNGRGGVGIEALGYLADIKALKINGKLVR